MLFFSSLCGVICTVPPVFTPKTVEKQGGMLAFFCISWWQNGTFFHRIWCHFPSGGHPKNEQNPEKWLPGPVWEPSRFGSRKKCQKRSGFGLKFCSFSGRFRTLWCLFESVFFACFQERPFCAFWAILWPRGSQKGGFWRPFRRHSGGGPNM